MIFEKIKSGMLAILFALCLILAGQLLLDLKGSSSESASAIAAKEKTIDYETLLYPQSCSVGFGGGLYKGFFSTETKQNLWQESRKYIKNYVEYLEIERISQEDWDAAVKSKGARFVMPFSMSVQQLQDMLLEKQNSSGSSNMIFDTIIVPVNADTYIYLGLSMKGEYYRLEGVKRDTYLDTLLTETKSEVNLYDTKTIEELYAPSKKLAVPGEPFMINQVFFPADQVESIPFVRIKDEIILSELSEMELKNYVSKAFNNRYDFLKRIEDIDGSVVYLYGYGDRALKIGTDGVIRYKNLYEKVPNVSAVSFREGLAVAVEALQNYGEMPKGFYLSEYRESRDAQGNNLKHYGFSYEMENLPIFLGSDNKGQSMTVEITENQVTNVERKLSSYVTTFSIGEIWDEPMNVLALVELNYDILSENFVKTDYEPNPNPIPGEEKDVNLAFEVLQNIRAVELVYYLNVNQSESLVPAWHIVVGSHQYIINIYSGEILKWIPPEGVN